MREQSRAFCDGQSDRFHHPPQSLLCCLCSLAWFSRKPPIRFSASSTQASPIILAGSISWPSPSSWGLIWLSLSRYGTIRLGQPYENRSSPLSAGSRCCSAPVWGLGWSTGALPSPYCITRIPEGAGTTIEAARQAMVYSFFHWGLHAWAIYVVLGMSVAYFSFRKQLPLTIRSIFYPMLGDRIYGPIGHPHRYTGGIRDTFGLATSLGFGAMQLNTGLYILTGMPVSQWVQVGIIASITAVAVMSVISGSRPGSEMAEPVQPGARHCADGIRVHRRSHPVQSPVLSRVNRHLLPISSTQMSLSTDAF